MKKIFAIIMIVCLMASLLCVTAFAAETDTTSAPAEGVVLRVRAQKKDGTIDFIGDYKSFQEGWDVGRHYSCDNWDRGRHGYVRSIVDFYADWHADEDGNLTSYYDTLGKVTTYYNSSMTINLNGHTIDRGLTDWKYNGEVLNICMGSDVIINDGTITGGYSCNGAGGIHIDDRANVVLNNVNVVGNTVEDDDGSAIAVYDGATLTMNGGSISNNTLYTSEFFFGTPYGGIYLNDSTAYLKDVVFEGNKFEGFDFAYGVAIYVDDSELVAENCTFRNNGYRDPSKKIWTPNSIVTIDGGSMTLNNCLFEENGKGSSTGPDVISVFGGATVEINNSKFLNNVNDSIIFGVNGSIEVSECHFEGNTGCIYYGRKNGDAIFKGCNFVGGPAKTGTKSFYLEKNANVELDTCELGGSTYNDESRVTFVNCGNEGAKRYGSIFGEGSFVAVISILSLVTSIAALALVLYPKLANGAPVATIEEEDEESDETSEEEVAEEKEATEEVAEEAPEATETTEE